MRWTTSTLEKAQRRQRGWDRAGEKKKTDPDPQEEKPPNWCPGEKEGSNNYQDGDLQKGELVKKRGKKNK